MTDKIGWGILGAGSIARKFATDLKNLDDAALVAVGSRSGDKAASFADELGVTRAYGSYAGMVNDPEVDVVYVATPHPFHREHTILCLEAGKAVLCEKPMAVNAAQVREMVSCARRENVFMMEAMWTRFNPVTVQVRQWLAEGRIGEVRLLEVDFGFRAALNPEGRLFNPALAGGALLDVGIYVVAFAAMVLGRPPTQIQAAAHLGETGVDEQTGMVFKYDRGELALLSCAVRATTPQEARIVGTAGSIHMPAFWHAPAATLAVPGQEPVVFTGDFGYQYEAAEVMACLCAGLKESATMPLDESMTIAETMDEVRRQIGLRYPME
ncbi:MAG: Gfo/Idh/MocA family oxidoreductase [Anaerolineae bacterium]|nr:Gfo/Idh/MocA family oxidoreductase [Anaerolineae bacterium]